MMIVKTPLKDNKTRPNRRSSPSRTKQRSKRNGSRGRGFGNGSRTNGSGSGNGTVYGTRKKKPSGNKLSLPGFTAWKIILCALVIGVLGTLYLGHVFATQELLGEVEQLEKEYNKAKRHHADYRLTYDRMTGPKEIYQKAKELGLVNGGPADKVIEVEGD